MAKIVLAGRSDCPYYAKCELLGDRLAKNLNKFNLHKIVVQPDQWEEWLTKTCAERGWAFTKSPIIWRELIDRGGKGVLIGDYNDFQEYVKAYYNIESNMDSEEMVLMASENKATKDIVDEEVKAYKALSNPFYICLTNGGSPVCYHLLNSLSSGNIFSSKTEITIRLLVTSSKDMERAKGYAMEAEDIAHGVLLGVTVCTNTQEAFEGCSVIILLDNLSKPTLESQKEWLEKCADLFGRYATIINNKALKNCKILLCGDGPMNFSATIVMKNACNMDRYNIVAVPTVENHAKSVIGEKLGVNSADVVNLIVWGNIKQNRLLDLNNCYIYRHKGAVRGPSWYSIKGTELIHGKKFIDVQFPKLVNTRHQKVAEVLGYTTSLSTSAAISQILQYWLNGSPVDQVFSLVVCSEGWYEVPPGMFFSFPVKFDPKGSWTVATDLTISKETKAFIQSSIKEIKSQLLLYSGGKYLTDNNAMTSANTTDRPFYHKQSVPKVEKKSLLEVNKEVLPKVNKQFLPKVNKAPLPKVNKESSLKVNKESSLKVNKESSLKVNKESLPQVKKNNLPLSE